MHCDEEESQQVVTLLSEGVSKQVKRHCNCNNLTATSHENAQLLCHSSANISIFRIELAHDSIIGYALAWLNSPNPFIFADEQILLIDTSQTCPYFISDIDDEDCVFTSDDVAVTSSNKNCDGPIVGTLFGTLIFSCLLVSLIWLFVIFLCWSRNDNHIEESRATKLSFRLHRKQSRNYENVIGPLGANTLKLNTLPLDDSEKHYANTQVTKSSRRYI